MYGNCGECKEKQIETKPFDQNLPVVYSQWDSEKKREFRNGETKEVIVTKRKEEEISLWIYLSEFTMNYG